MKYSEFKKKSWQERTAIAQETTDAELLLEIANHEESKNVLEAFHKNLQKLVDIANPTDGSEASPIPKELEPIVENLISEGTLVVKTANPPEKNDQDEGEAPGPKEDGDEPNENPAPNNVAAKTDEAEEITNAKNRSPFDPDIKPEDRPTQHLPVGRRFR